VNLTLHLGRLRLVFDFWFFAVITCFALLNHQALLLYLALPVLIHEVGHLVVLAWLKIPVAEVYFGPASITIRTRSSHLSYPRELAVACAGVAANLLAAFFLWRMAFQSMRTMLMVASNLAVALFNLLPAGQLDGGQILRCLCDILFPPGVARNISRIISFALLTPLFALSVLLLLRGVANFTLLLCCVYLVVTVMFRD
jgi:stage IV sporulation protein FB